MGGHCGGAGRAARMRRQKHKDGVRPVSLCHQPPFVTLMTFLHRRGFTSPPLQPSLFTDTGRGLQALKAIKPGQLLVSLPESCLLMTSTVLDSYLGSYIKSWKPRLSPLLVLCVFLVCEQHRGEASDWFPYINILPSKYSCPAYFTDDVISVLPLTVQRRALQQREAVREIHSSNQDFFRSLQPILSEPVNDVLTFEALRWAWCSVNTRSVFMPRPSSHFLSGPDVCALAPFLDLLNHRPDMQVSAGFCDTTRCYEIRTVSGIRRHQQAFINYGSHDNHRLLLEYGFIAPSNPHSMVYVDTDLLCDVLRGDRSLEQKLKFLRENDFLRDLSVSADGPGWRLMTALRVLSLTQTQYPQWKAVLLGQAVCGERERWSILTAVTLCQRLLQDSERALDTISCLLQRCDDTVRAQLGVVTLLRQEEKCILGSCFKALQSSLTNPHALP
ncbi:SET domain-containing protein 4 [Thalassophryne amazonica]|uniref:SET domain-containing protein 4 n=1 Tax=Thalassophryne amazonica TaxID=390379 RepID=UPI001470ABC9|nr:SET domain-containing protein 4 [Thalassophryne amazonica]XP_034041594.1 SET domain-containing protein 4 [Thalassophryne amazonica]